MSQEYQLSPEMLRENLADFDAPFLLDVREEWEYTLAHLPDSVHIPLGELPERVDELPRDEEIVVLCHHGMRSMSALSFLVRQGFTQIKNLTGGIDAYAQIDPTIPRYR